MSRGGEIGGPSRQLRVLALIGASLTSAAALGLAMPLGAYAHGVVVGRQDLPIPEWLFTWGAALVLVVSFIALTVAWQTSRYESDSWRPFPAWFSRLVVNRFVELLCGAIGAFLLVVVIYAGLAGTEAPDRNIAVPFVFVTFWLGFVLVNSVFGDVFRAFNPWRAIARFFAAIFTAIARQPSPAPLTYPERLGRWPAAIVIAAFMWFELVYSIGFQAVGVTPRDVGIAACLYSVYTFTAMMLFGIDKWLERGEAFSVLFGMFARISPFEVRDRRLGRRRWLSATTSWMSAPGSVALVLIVIGGTAYDGAQEGVLSGAISSTFTALMDVGFSGSLAFRTANTLFMAIVIGMVAALFWAGIAGMHTVKTSRSTKELGRLFAHAFIPIALAYLLAHYFSLIWFLEQAQFTFLLSDPLGRGSDLFGTASGGIDYGSLASETIWYVQVAALVVGHVLALVLGHDRAIKVYRVPKLAARSQYWMLVLMVGFTSLGLFLLSQSNA